MEQSRPLYFCPVVSSFFISSFFLRLISVVGDWMSAILPHMVWAISSQLRHVSTIGKKNLLSSNISSRCHHNMVNFGPALAVEIGPTVWGTPANLNGFRVLAALLHSSQVVGASQTLRRWTEGATYVRQDGHHVGHWPTFQFSVFWSAQCTCRKTLVASLKADLYWI